MKIKQGGELLVESLEEFDRHGISIPFPPRDIYLRQLAKTEQEAA